MEIKTIDTELLAGMLITGAKSLDAKREWINELNVFPIPDGDTGTNMCMTIESAIREMDKTGLRDMAEMSKAISSGSLRGARGNSGVILSQLMRGFAKVIANYEEIDKMVICESFQKACETAYKAVMKPKEGTILTVARAAADKALELSGVESCSLCEYMDEIVAEAERVLAMTPEMLPVLKQAGVVDAGGQGLLEIFKGARDALYGEKVDYIIPERSESPAPSEPDSPDVSLGNLSTDDVKFGYCTEFIINLDEELHESEEKEYRDFLNSIGDSIVLVPDSEFVKTHVHTNDPGLVIQKALTYGSLSHIKIDNMREQHEERLFKNAEKLAREQEEELAAREEAKKPVTAPEPPEKEIGFIAVSIGDGMNEVFMGLGADHLIEGGQTMNPSTEDMLKAISQVNAQTVFIFPNNKNIILAANQAASMAKEREVVVIPTRTLPQGITALINFVPEAGVEANRELMTEVIDMVKTGQVTYAIRDTSIDGLDIKEGDYMGIGDSSILSAGKDIDQVVKDMLREMIDEESSFICMYYGDEVSEESAEALGSYVSREYPDCEVEIQHGGQPVYYYIVSVE